MFSPLTATTQGAATADEINRGLGTHLPSGAGTVAGLLAEELGRPARPGDILELADARLTARIVESGAVDRVHVERPEPPLPGE